MSRTGPLETLETLGRILADNDEVRSALVELAQSLCFDSAGVLLCAPDDPRVQDLRTDRLDQGMRLALKDFRKRYAAASVADQAVMQGDLNYDTSTSGCANSQDAGEHICTMFELLVTQPSHLETMTSDPLDSRTKRYGF